MKHFGLLCIFLILIHFSTQIPKFENCTESFKETFNSCECCQITCFPGGTNEPTQEKGCRDLPEFMCAGTHIEHHAEDNKKLYPDCCAHSICKTK